MFRVNALIVPSMAERVLVDNTADLNATIEVVEAATGKVVLSFADRPTFDMMLGGVAAPVVDTVAAMVVSLMASFAAWVSGKCGRRRQGWVYWRARTVRLQRRD